MSATGQRAFPRQRAGAGYSLLELVVALIVIIALAGFALDRVMFYQERAEKAAMEGILALVKMGLQMRLAELIVTNRQMLAAALERENPLILLDPPPGNYAGEYAPPLKSGCWYYASRERELVYVPSSTAYLEGLTKGATELRFRVVLHTEKNAQTGQPAPIGVGLLPSRDFRWF
jgi:general secretion pathway protein G